MEHKTDIDYPGSFKKLAEDLVALPLDSFTGFLNYFSLKLSRDAIADFGRGRTQLSIALNSCSINICKASKQADIARKLIRSSVTETELNYLGGYVKLSEDLGDLRYDILAVFINLLSKAVEWFSNKYGGDRKSAAPAALKVCSSYINVAAGHMSKAWKLSEPHMKPDGSC